MLLSILADPTIEKQGLLSIPGESNCLSDLGADLDGVACMQDSGTRSEGENATFSAALNLETCSTFDRSRRTCTPGSTKLKVASRARHSWSSMRRTDLECL